MKILVLAAILCIAPAASAQSDAPAVHEGARVKLRTATVHAAIGTVVSSTSDSVVLADEKGARLGVARKDITQQYVSIGRTTAQGAKKGATWGAGIGAVGALMMIPDPCGHASDKARCKAVHEGESRPRIAAAFALSTVVTSTIVGALVKAEQWSEVGGQPRVTIRPKGAGVALAVNFR